MKGELNESLWKKITEVIEADGLRVKDIVMAYGYDGPKVLYIHSTVLKEVFTEQILENSNFKAMHRNKRSFVVFGLDFQTQKTWILHMDNEPNDWKIKKGIDDCREYYINRLTQQWLRERKLSQLNESLQESFL